MQLLVECRAFPPTLPMTKHTILFLAADPNGTDPRTLDREARAIQVELERSGFRDHFKLETRWAAEPLDLLRELRKLRPTVVHFAGRGTADAALRFLGPDGRVQLVSVQALEETFGAGGSSVQLVILSACYSDVQARALLPHVGCVVGVSGALHDTAARSFAIGFYGGLGERESVAAAFKQGCAAIRLEGLGDRHLPQLMVRAGVDAATLILGSPDAAATPVNSFTAPPPAPAYPDAATRTRSEWLEDARLRRRMLRDAGQPTDETDREILEVRRQLREGGQLRAGDSLDDGRYLLVQEVGRGGFAVVWDAYDRTEQQHVAIKVLHTNLAGDPLRRERFFRGARAMRGLVHPAVVRVLEPEGEDGGFHYFVMELLTGGNLRQAVLANRVANERALPLLLHVIEAVASAHARAMVHRDIKPANILLDGEGNPKLTDFDLVGGADTTGGTRTGAMGTFIYAAPECLDKPQEATARADVYGLGMTALFCLSGQELALSVFRNPELLIARLACSDRVRDVLRRAVAWEPGDRFADADALGHTLREALASRHRELEGADLLTSPGPGPVAGGAEPVSSPVAEPPYLEVEITFDGEHQWLSSREGPPDREVGIEPHDGPGSGAVNPDTWPTEKTRVWKPALSPAKLSEDVVWRKPVRRSRPWVVLASAVATFAVGLIAYNVFWDAPIPWKPQFIAPKQCPEGMVHVQAGMFQMGSPDGEGDADEHPQHAVTLSGYCIDRTEVTVKAYEACVTAKECSVATPTVMWTGDSKYEKKRSQNCNRDNQPDHPMNCVDWDQSAAYCKWAKKRLPTEAEWEYAARGSEGRDYPWGNNKPSEALLNACGTECVAMAKRDLKEDWIPMYHASDSWKTTAPVGSLIAGKSPFGALDMAGNVSEWTADWYGEYEASPQTNPQGAKAKFGPVFRGGAWNDYQAGKVRAASRAWKSSSTRSDSLGFRCARGD